MGTSNVWRCLMPGAGGDCNVPDELGCSYTGGDEYLWGAFWLIRLEAGLEDWGASAGALAAARAVEAEPFSMVRTPPWLAECEYTSTPGCDGDFPIAAVSRVRLSLSFRPDKLSPSAPVAEPATVRSTSVVELLNGCGFRLADSTGPAPFAPPTLPPLGGAFMLCG